MLSAAPRYLSDWQFHDVLFGPELRSSSRSKSTEWNVDAVLTELEKRFDTDDFATSDIHFDPVEWLELDELQRNTLIARRLPKERLHAVGNRHVEREWLS